MKTLMNYMLALGVAVFVMQKPAQADDTLSQKTQEVVEDSGKAIKKGYRNVKDKTCHLVKGKMECATDKAKHKIQNAADEVKDKSTDVTGH